MRRDDINSEVCVELAGFCRSYLITISGNGGAVRVYLDKVRLLDGQRFDIGFICGLASSTVFGPLLSGSCLKSFVELGHVSSHRARFRVYAFACDRLM